MLIKKRDLQNRFDLIRAKDKEAQKYYQRTKDMFLYLGQLKSTVELIERLSGTGGIEDIINSLVERKRLLEKIISASHINELSAIRQK